MNASFIPPARFAQLAHNPITWFVFASAVLLGLVVWLPAGANVAVVPAAALHTTVEMFVTIAASLVFAAGWMGYLGEQPRSFAWLAGAFLAVALTTFAHFMSFEGMPAFITPNSHEKSLFFREASYLIESAALFAIAWWPALRPITKRGRTRALLAGLTLAAVVFAVGFFSPMGWPLLFIDGQGPAPFTVALELITIGLLVAATIGLVRRPLTESFPLGLAAAAALSAIGEVYFLLHAHPTDVFSVLAHTHKVAAYGFIAQAVFAETVQRPVRRLRASEARYRHLFENSPLSLWEEDLSAIHRQMELLRQQGVTDMRAYLREHPERVAEWAALAKVVDVNQAAVDLMRTQSKEELLTDLATVLHETGLENFREELIAIANNKRQHTLERPHRFADGQSATVRIHWSAAPDDSGGYAHVIVTAEDVTERLWAVTALRESETRFRQMADTMPALVWMSNENRLCTYVNRPWLEYTGRLMEDELGSGGLDSVHPEDVEHYSATYAAAFDARQPFTMDYRLRRADGAYRWVVNNGAPRWAPDGRFLGYIGACMDITDRKQAEANLRESEERYRSLAEASADSIFIINADGTVAYVNSTAARLFNATPEAIIGQPRATLFPPEVSAQQATNLRQVLETGQPLRREALNRYPDRATWEETQLIPLRDAAGQVTAVMGVAHDITERKHAEESLRQTAELLEQVFSTTHMLIAYLDAGFNFLRVNRAYAETDNRAPEFFTGKNHFALYPNPENEAIFRRVVQTGEPYSVIAKPFEYAENPERGVTHWDWSLMPVKGSAGQVTGLVLTLINATERIRAEEKLRESETRYRIISELVSDYAFAFVVDPVTRAYTREWTTEAFERITGYPPDDPLVANGLGHIVHPDDLPMLKRRTQRLLAGEPDFSEFRITRKDGALRWISNYGVSVADESGHVTRVYGAVQDITERKETEARLREGEARWRGLFENSPISLWEEDFSAVKARLDDLRRAGVTDFAAYFAAHPEAVRECADLVQVLDVNQAGVRLLGAEKKEDLLGKLTPNLRGVPLADFADELTSLAQGVTGYQWEGKNTAADGHMGEMSLRWAAMPGHEQDWARVMVSIEDITARRQAEEKLRVSETNLRALFNAITDLLYLVNTDDTLLAVNNGGAARLGRTPSELIGQSLGTLLPPEVYQRRHVFVEQALAGQPVRFEDERDGRWFDNSLYPVVEADGRVSRLAVFARDITERRQAETKLSRRMDELTAIYEAARAMQKLYTPDELEKIIIHVLEQLLHYKYAAVLLIDPKTGRLIPGSVSAQGNGADFTSADKAYIVSRGIHVGKGITGWVAQTGQSARVGEVSQDPRYFAVREDIRSELCVPLRAGDQIIGVVNVETTTPDAYTEADQRLLETVATQIAAAIQNTRLYEAVQRELAERQKAEEAQRELARYARSLLEASLDPLVTINAEGKITDVNEATETATGLPRAQLIGSDFSGYFTEPHKAREGYETVFSRGSVQDYPLEIRHTSGQVMSVLYNATVYRDEAGNVQGVFAAARDITERKRAEMQLRETLATLNSIFNTEHVAMGVIEIVSESDARYVAVNEATGRLFGRAPQELDGRLLSEINVPEDIRRLWIGQYHTSEREGHHISFEYERQLSDGPHWFLASVHPISERRYTYLMLDITERQRAEQKLHASLREKDVLVKEVHHRVKNNLQVMVSLLNLQAQHIHDPEALAVFVDTQERVRSMALVHEKLYQSPDMARINFADYLHQLTGNLFSIFRANPSVAAEVDAEEIWLGVDTAIPCGLIVNELVSNALKYAFPAQRPGLIRVRLQLEAEAAPRRLRLVVSDDGVGLPPEVDVAHTATLGLQLVHILTQQLRGQVTVERAGGTAFHIIFTER